MIQLSKEERQSAIIVQDKILDIFKKDAVNCVVVYDITISILASLVESSNMNMEELNRFVDILGVDLREMLIKIRKRKNAIQS